MRYDLFETDFLTHLRVEDWDRVVNEGESAALKVAREELNKVKTELDRVTRLIERRTEQASEEGFSISK